MAGQSHSAVFKLLIFVYTCLSLFQPADSCFMLTIAVSSLQFVVLVFFKLPLSPASFHTRLFKAANICAGLLTDVLVEFMDIECIVSRESPASFLQQEDSL